MNIRKCTVAVFMAVTSVLPAVSYATSQWHSTDSEAGVIYQPDHFKSNTTRTEVVAGVGKARSDGTLVVGERGDPVPSVKTAGADKTRQQVTDEMRNQSPAERQAQMQLLAGS
ncbi:MAG: DUF4148 domain-containing protein [Burkholderiaceae bacterium]|jgi:hypothetical protein|nr:DUF4148 domain-containing protein [Burkholderiaceae bacterium]